MSQFNMEYIRKHYKVPAKRGMLVMPIRPIKPGLEVCGRIKSAQDGWIHVRFSHLEYPIRFRPRDLLYFTEAKYPS